MRTYEVKFAVRFIDQPGITVIHTVKASTPEKARAAAWGLFYETKTPNAKAKFLSVKEVKSA